MINLGEGESEEDKKASGVKRERVSKGNTIKWSWFKGVEGGRKMKAGLYDIINSERKS